jgi:hypothetical protein
VALNQLRNVDFARLFVRKCLRRESRVSLSPGLCTRITLPSTGLAIWGFELNFFVAGQKCPDLFQTQVFAVLHAD